MARRKALVIAEADTLGHLLSIALRKEDFDVTVVDPFGSGSVEEVYGEISTKKYDLIMPTNNGLVPGKILELISKIREKDRDVKIIVLSGYREADFIMELKERGIDEFFPMAFNINDLMRKVNELVRTDGE